METVLTSRKPSRRDGKVVTPQDGDARHNSATSAANKALITRNLRMAFDQIAGEPIPDRMLELLEELSLKEDAVKDGGQ